MTKARVHVEDKRLLVEDFVLGSAQRPIMCAGKRLRKGWCLKKADGGPFELQENCEVLVNTERNSLQYKERSKLHHRGAPWQGPWH